MKISNSWKLAMLLFPILGIAQPYDQNAAALLPAWPEYMDDARGNHIHVGDPAYSNAAALHGIVDVATTNEVVTNVIVRADTNLVIAEQHLLGDLAAATSNGVSFTALDAQSVAAAFRDRAAVITNIADIITLQNIAADAMLQRSLIVEAGGDPATATGLSTITIIATNTAPVQASQ